MSQNDELKNFFIRLIFTFLIVGIGFREVLDSKKIIKVSQENIYKARNLFHKLNIMNLTPIYELGARFSLFISYSLIIAGILFLFRIEGYMIFAHMSFILNILLINNVFLDNSSKCILTASIYLSIYASFYTIK